MCFLGRSWSLPAKVVNFTPPGVRLGFTHRRPSPFQRTYVLGKLFNPFAPRTLHERSPRWSTARSTQANAGGLGRGFSPKGGEGDVLLRTNSTARGASSRRWSSTRRVFQAFGARTNSAVAFGAPRRPFEARDVPLYEPEGVDEKPLSGVVCCFMLLTKSFSSRGAGVRTRLNFATRAFGALPRPS